MSHGGCLSSATLQGLVFNVHGQNDVGSSSPHLNLAVLASHAEHLVLVAVQAHVAHTLGRATTDGGRKARAVVGGVQLAEDGGHNNGLPSSRHRERHMG